MTIHYIGIYLLFVICRRNIGESTCEDFFSSTCFKSKFTKGSNIYPPPSRNFSFTKDAITPFSSRSSRDESIFTSARASNLPGTAPASPQLEASALSGTPQAPPQLITHEIPLEPEQTPSPIQEARNEVSISIQLCYFPSINHP
jgi:hypothetical protein